MIKCYFLKKEGKMNIKLITIIISFFTALLAIPQTHAAIVPTQMTGTTIAPSGPDIKIMNPTEEVFEAIAKSNRNFGQSWSTENEGYTLEKIWIMGNYFTTYQFAIEMYQMQTPNDIYNEISNNLFSEPQYAVLEKSTTSQWVIFDVENIILNPNSYYIFKIIDGGNEILRWYEGDPYYGGSSSYKKQYLPTQDFAFAIQGSSQQTPYTPEISWWGIVLVLFSIFTFFKFDFKKCD
ncbi:membrane protein [Candidatus Omnitrophus magneticus]|uniref:Membrane protein n=1 Tax=Candidatus Omnitrophus magneticus TaxID=1609969 RepID=A0A0F0CS14_9BACT|nr:membrane protein [Candidatus Omnitrophus magneticus]